MASIGSLTGSTSSTSSIYGNRTNNIISGLASGLDTESMIQGLVQSYQQKIQSLQKDRTVLEWQQNAYQSISNKLVEFSRKYTSYTSPETNLLSPSFFSNAISTVANGKYADLVSASGTSSSTIQINSITSLATSARYSVAGTSVDKSISIADDKLTVTGGKLDLSGNTTISNMDGSLSITYGTKEVTIKFDKDEVFTTADGSLDTEKLKKSIEEKLKEQTISTSGGSGVASDYIGVSVADDGTISFSDKKNAGNSVFISDATGNLKTAIKDADDAIDGEKSSFQLDTSAVSKKLNNWEYLSGQTISVTLDGETKKITLPTNQQDQSQWVKDLQATLDDNFGKDKITVGQKGDALTFTVNGTSSLAITSSDDTVNEIMGWGDAGVTSYVNTKKTLGALLGDELNNLTPTGQDENGNSTYSMTINGETFGEFTKDTKLSEVLDAINNSDAGVNVSYSQLTGKFVFTAKETGSQSEINFEDDFATTLFGDPSNEVTKGQDATINITVNGEEMTLTRQSNTFDLDGMSLTINGTFNTDPNNMENAPITFTSKTDADTIVDTIKSMVNDYNAIMEEVKKAYSDMPLEQSNGDPYEPLTDDEMADMSDSAISAYEEKAKTGILFMDSDLSSLYNDLRNTVSVGESAPLLRAIGITTSYSDGQTTLTLDEAKLRQALEENPDQVKNAFTQSTKTGGSFDGLMTSIQSVTDRYASTTGATKGILIEKAGSQYSPTSALKNDLLDKMNDIDDEISSWQDKMSDKVDYYTNKFTQLEMLINQMNSQSSTLSGLLGG